MGILEIVQLVLTVLTAVLPTILTMLKEWSDVKKSKFDLGLSELHAADERMRAEGHQHQSAPVQPR